MYFFYGDFWESDLRKEGRREGEGGRGREEGKGRREEGRREEERREEEREGGEEGLEHVWRGGDVRNCYVMGVCLCV